MLQNDRHDVRQQGDEEQRVAELRAAGERRRPVAGVHVADGDEVARAAETGASATRACMGAYPAIANHLQEYGKTELLTRPCFNSEQPLRSAPERLVCKSPRQVLSAGLV